MKKSIIAMIILLAIVLFFSINSSNEPTDIPTSKDGQTLCQPEQRNAGACIEIYQPVCASIDTGIRCITEPCDSFELKTYSNGCFACSDPKVIHYEEGECL
jgi:hypothetical protein